MKLKDLKPFLSFNAFIEAIVVTQRQSIPFNDYKLLVEVINTKYVDYEISDIYLTYDGDVVVELKE